MGLSGSFGNQNHICKNCGHTSALYSPNCPVCLSEDVNRPQKANSKPEQADKKSAEPEHRAGLPLVPLAVVAVVLTIAAGAYTMLNPSQPEPVSTKVLEPARPDPPRRVVRTVKRNVSPAKQGPRVRSTASAGPSPRRAPMKLWTVTPDSE